jgi:hypothetical protein
LFDGVLAVGNCCGQSTLALGDSQEFVDRLFVSGSYFRTLGVNALLGRVLNPADDEVAGGPDGTAAVLSYTAWKRRFNGDTTAVGMHVLLDRAPVTIVGVLPPFFLGTEVGRTFDFFLPGRRASAVLFPTFGGRLKSDLTVDTGMSLCEVMPPLIDGSIICGPQACRTRFVRRALSGRSRISPKSPAISRRTPSATRIRQPAESTAEGEGRSRA